MRIGVEQHRQAFLAGGRWRVARRDPERKDADDEQRRELGFPPEAHDRVPVLAELNVTVMRYTGTVEQAAWGPTQIGRIRQPRLA